MRRVVILVIMVLLGILLLVRMLNEPNSAAAARQMRAFVDGNTDVFFETALEEELYIEGLTKAKMREVYQVLVKPRLRMIRIDGDLSTETANHPVTQARAVQRVTYPNGYQSSISTITNNTEEGPRRAILQETLTMAWMVELQARKSTPLNAREALEGQLRALEGDRATLERLGLRGWYGPNHGFRTWDELADAYRRDIERN